MDENRISTGWVSSSMALVGGCYWDSSVNYQCFMPDGVTSAVPFNFVFENNEFKNAARSCILGFGFPTGGPASPIPFAASFINNDVNNCGSEFYDQGMYLGGSNILVENNRVWNIAGFGVQLHNEDFNNREVTIRNNF